MEFEAAAQFAKPLIEALAGKHGTVVQVIVLMGSLRVFLKPLTSLARTYVEFTPSKSDDEKLEKILNSEIYKKASFVIDYFASLKLPQKKEE